MRIFPTRLPNGLTPWSGNLSTCEKNWKTTDRHHSAQEEWLVSEGPRITQRVQEILGYYQSDSPGIRVNLARLLMSGRLAGTGKLLILPVDQGFEHGPARSFAANLPGMIPFTTLNWLLMPDAMPMRLRWGFWRPVQRNMPDTFH